MNDDYYSPLTPDQLAEHYGIQKTNLDDIQQTDVLAQFNDVIAKQAEEWQRVGAQIDEINEQTAAGIEDMIQRQAEANAEAYMKAMRSSPVLFDNVIAALSALCGNRHYNSTCDEDTMNDYVRDMLGQILQVRDQTRQGISGNSKTAEKGKAGEVDIQIRNNGRPIGLYEGLRLESVVEKEIHDHIMKATVNYNPQGVKQIFVVAYVIGQTTRFGEFWNRFTECVERYNPVEEEYRIIWDDEEEETEVSAIRSLHGTCYMDNVEHHVHVIAAKIMK